MPDVKCIIINIIFYLLHRNLRAGWGQYCCSSVPEGRANRRKGFGLPRRRSRFLKDKGAARGTWSLADRRSLQNTLPQRPRPPAGMSALSKKKSDKFDSVEVLKLKLWARRTGGCHSFPTHYQQIIQKNISDKSLFISAVRLELNMALKSSADRKKKNALVVKVCGKLIAAIQSAPQL